MIALFCTFLAPVFAERPEAEKKADPKKVATFTITRNPNYGDLEEYELICAKETIRAEKGNCELVYSVGNAVLLKAPVTFAEATGWADKFAQTIEGDRLPHQQGDLLKWKIVFTDGTFNEGSLPQPAPKDQKHVLSGFLGFEGLCKVAIAKSHSKAKK